MRLAHPAPQPLPPLHARLVAPPRHPRPEVVRAHPTRVQRREQAQELPHVGLLRGRRPRRVTGGDAVQQRPGVVAQLGDVGGAVGAGWGSGVRGGVDGGEGGGEGRGGEGGRGSVAGGGGGGGGGAHHVAPFGGGGAGAAAEDGCMVSGLGSVGTGLGKGGKYGLPSLPRTTPLGSFLGSSSVWGSIVLEEGGCELGEEEEEEEEEGLRCSAKNLSMVQRGASWGKQRVWASKLMQGGGRVGAGSPALQGVREDMAS